MLTRKPSARTTTLQVVEHPDGNATKLRFAPGKGIVGDEDEDLLCGGCGAVLGRGISQATLGARFKVPAQLLVCCPTCNKHNRLNAIAGN